MNYYTEITLLPGIEIGMNFLWSKVYEKIHLRLVNLEKKCGSQPVGISLPEYSIENRSPGSKLRLFATDEKLLDGLDVSQVLAHLKDYVHVTRLRSVPSGVKNFAVYRRAQPAMSTAKQARLLRRKASREGRDIKRVLKDFLETNPSKSSPEHHTNRSEPYIYVRSLSSGQQFSLHIKKESASALAFDGFNCYGLSSVSSVPEF